MNKSKCYGEYIAEISALVEAQFQAARKPADVGIYNYDIAGGCLGLSLWRGAKLSSEVTEARRQKPVAVLRYRSNADKRYNGEIVAFFYVGDDFCAKISDMKAVILWTPNKFLERGMSIEFGDDPRHL